jgi:hypothetical protein
MNAAKKAAIRKRLALIEKQNGGRLTADDVIKDARDSSSPLHDQFEWDADKAAYKHWIDRAREIITSVKVVEIVESYAINTVFYVRDPSAGEKEQGYVSLTTLRSEADLAREAIHTEFLRARSMLHRAKTLAAVLEMENDVEDISNRVDALLRKVSYARMA